MARRSTITTGMAGEFYVMEKLFRLGFLPALTLGNAKTVDIFVRVSSGRTLNVSVKAITARGKWGVGSSDYEVEENLIFVLLYYRSWGDFRTQPDAYILPATVVNTLKREWFRGYAVYMPPHRYKADLAEYLENWNLFEQFGEPIRS